MPSMRGKSLVGTTIEGPREDDPAARTVERPRRADRGRTAGEQAEDRGAAARHRGLRRSGAAELVHQTPDLRMPTSDDRLEIVAHRINVPLAPHLRRPGARGRVVPGKRVRGAHAEAR